MRYLALLILIFQCPVCLGQDGSVTLNGKVTDDSTGSPLPLAFVFLNNSTLVAQTDEKGDFSLDKLPLGDLDIRVSFLGYEPLKQTLRFEQPGAKTVSFKMKQGINLDDVIIRAAKDKRRNQLLKIIAIEILGQSRFRKQCKILNPDVLRIYDDEEGHLRAKSVSPLIIENQGLGYRIFQDIEDFNYFGGMVFYGGSTRFEELVPKDEDQKKRWQINQKQAYEGSLKHLLISMVSDKMDQEGFKIYQTRNTFTRQIIQFGNAKKIKIIDSTSNRVQVEASAFIRPGKLESERLLVSEKPMDVFYTKKKGRSPYSDMPYAYSQMFLPQKEMLITTQGWVVRPMGFIVEGDLSFDRLSTLLPANWSSIK